MSLKHVVVIDENLDVEGVVTTAPADDMTSGNPSTTMWTAYSGPVQSVISGIWESEKFEKKISRPSMVEYFFILEGEIKLTDEDGNSEIFRPGQGVIVKPGFDGIWESLTKVRKHFFIGVC